MPAVDKSLIVGQYRLLELLGRGAMGQVYRARHQKLGREVAIKLLDPKLYRSKELMEQFTREAQAAASIRHEHVVQLFDLVRDGDGKLYQVMELLKGRGLREALDERGRLPLPRALRIGLQIAEAMKATHDSGVVHRDLKPENVFLTSLYGQKDYVKLLDFGVACLQEHRSKDGPGVGTPAYMAPEQARGDEITPAADIYSLGVVLFELTRGRLPFRANTAVEFAIAHTTQTLEEGHLRRVPKRFSQLVRACMEKDPALRISSMDEVARELRRIAKEQGIRLVLFEGMEEDCRRPRWPAAAAVAAAVIALGGMGLWMRPTSEVSAKQTPLATARTTDRATTSQTPATGSPASAARLDARSSSPAPATPATLELPPNTARSEERRNPRRPARRAVQSPGNSTHPPAARPRSSKPDSFGTIDPFGR